MYVMPRNEKLKRGARSEAEERKLAANERKLKLAAEAEERN